MNGTELRPFSREIMEGGYRAAFSLYAEEAEKNPEFRKIYGEWLKFREDIVQGGRSKLRVQTVQSV
ncbi:hypothetical protein [Bradyrhizobium neotropicale]|uniref:Uncharacterized protein n=1 Tax=Bradyrhizobium neotropicale TaxID=1497615 RepID=A0A176YJ94_9BRAD|nr:hypothetical protein [Bradyrhizobium neotropicale]OAF06291.1 hypothetical protein AXW67_32600 [Bradyrhizobium neotropicale]